MPYFLSKYLNNIPAEAKELAECPDGNEKSTGFFINGISSENLLKGLSLATSFLIIKSFVT